MYSSEYYDDYQCKGKEILMWNRGWNYSIQNKEFSIVEYSYDAKEEAELQNILTTVIESLYDYDDFVLTEVTRLLALLEQWYKARDQIQTSFVYHFDEKTTSKNVNNNNNQSCIETELTHNHHQHHRKIRWADEEGYELTLVKEFGHFHWKKAK